MTNAPAIWGLISFGSMSATNATIVRNAINGYKKQILEEIRKRCIVFCGHLCQEAIKARAQNKRAHDFTGNLITSIVVCLYENGKPEYAAYAAKYAPEAIQVKMRLRPAKSGNGYKSYRFKSDYEGKKSAYLPTIDTNGGWGVDDARKFFHSYKPSGGNLFDIVVVYPVEYADWVEMERGTTGIMQTYAHAEQVGVTYLKLQRK